MEDPPQHERHRGDQQHQAGNPDVPIAALSHCDEVANRLANRIPRGLSLPRNIAGLLPFESPCVYYAHNEDANEQEHGGDPVRVVNDPLEGHQASNQYGQPQTRRPPESQSKPPLRIPVGLRFQRPVFLRND